MRRKIGFALLVVLLVVLLVESKPLLLTSQCLCDSSTHFCW